MTHKNYINKKVLPKRQVSNLQHFLIKQEDRFIKRPNVRYHKRYGLKYHNPELWHAFYVEQLQPEPTDFWYKLLTKLHLKKTVNHDLLKRRQSLLNCYKWFK